MAILDDLLGLLKDPNFIKTILQTGSVVGGNIASTRAETDAINAAIKISQQNDQLQRDTLAAERSDRRDQTQLAIDLINTTRAEEAPFQELNLQRGKFGERFLPRIEATLSGVDIPGAPRPLESEIFKLNREKGLDTLRRKFAVTGSPSGGGAQVAGGEFVTNITAREIDRQEALMQQFRENLFTAAGITGERVESQAPGLVGAATQPLPSANVNPGNTVPNLLTAQGAARKGLFGDLGLAGSQIPNIFKLNQGLSSGQINIGDLFGGP